MKQGSKRPPKIEKLLTVIRECLRLDRFRETVHAQQRRSQRDIILQEVLYVLKNGRHEAEKDQYDVLFQSWNYAVRGNTVEKRDLRVIVSFEDIDRDQVMLIITAFYIGEQDEQA